MTLERQHMDHGSVGPTVVLTISARPEHVRTARLVALSVARRSGLGAAVEDEVRLAVGEACSRSVLRAAASGRAARLEVGLTLATGVLDVVVRDEQDDPADPDDEVSLRLLRGLASVVQIAPHAVHLTWRAPDGIVRSGPA